MPSLKEKVAYLKGLAAGLDVGDGGSREGRVLAELLEVLGAVADEIEELRLDQSELEDYVVCLDEDLAEIEDDLYDEDDEDFLEITCPHCNEDVRLDQELLDDDGGGELVCPACGEVIYDDEGWDDLDDPVEAGPRTGEGEGAGPQG